MAQHDTQPRAPRYLNQVAVAATDSPSPEQPRVASVQIARWSDGRRLAWHTLDKTSPIYQWALDGIHAATSREE